MMLKMDITNTTVIGAGIMGHGIAQLIASHGYQVSLVDLNDNILNTAKEAIKQNLTQFFVNKGKITQDQADIILNRISMTTNLERAVLNTQIVIEAVFEDMDIKQTLFSELDKICEKDVILASNTSSLSITQIASRAKNQERIVGIHFFNPATVMKLIELIKGEKTSENVLKSAKQFSETLNKTVVIVNDAPGFVTTRLIYVLCNEAVKLKQEGIASTEDIDKAVKLAFNFPMGPLELSDLVGLDIYLHIGEYLENQLGEYYKPSLLLKEMVANNLIGRKRKQGFYNY
ncbi:MAG: 3-hydroxyacyl-CoA dehydrogenase family protein [Candidatus Lokiarchaeota archaeon]|nr:3-hydroxyacyl-CoA dehydrogenase family protein [Candidatus Lokiarchaeota archaeon]